MPHVPTRDVSAAAHPRVGPAVRGVGDYTPLRPPRQLSLILKRDLRVTQAPSGVWSLTAPLGRDVQCWTNLAVSGLSVNERTNDLLHCVDHVKDR